MGRQWIQSVYPWHNCVKKNSLIPSLQEGKPRSGELKELDTGSPGCAWKRPWTSSFWSTGGVHPLRHAPSWGTIPGEAQYLSLGDIFFHSMILLSQNTHTHTHSHAHWQLGLVFYKLLKSDLQTLGFLCSHDKCIRWNNTSLVLFFYKFHTRDTLENYYRATRGEIGWAIAPKKFVCQEWGSSP